MSCGYRTPAYAKVLAGRFATETPTLVAARMAKAARWRGLHRLEPEQPQPGHHRALFAARAATIQLLLRLSLGMRFTTAAPPTNWPSLRTTRSTKARSAAISRRTRAACALCRITTTMPG